MGPNDSRTEKDVRWTAAMETELHWPGTGTLKLADRGMHSIALRYLPDLSVIARELAKHRQRSTQEPQTRDEQSTHRSL